MEFRCLMASITGAFARLPLRVFFCVQLVCGVTK